MAAGGTQLRSVFSDDGVYAFKYHVDWSNPANSTFTGPTKITVARYTYLCNGQLSSCVTQPSTTQRLDSQGDKLMQRLAYRNFGDHQSIVVTHSVNGPAGGGALRWYEFRVNAAGDPVLYQQSSFAPDAMYRWMGSAAMDRLGNIVIGYSFGGAPNFPGQRFVGRAAADPLGTMSLKETVIIAGAASQTSTLRWQDYATTVLDPSDDTTFWYVGNYLKAGARRPRPASPPCASPEPRLRRGFRLRLPADDVERAVGLPADIRARRHTGSARQQDARRPCRSAAPAMLANGAGQSQPRHADHDS